jgi:hypothetical protein
MGLLSAQFSIREPARGNDGNLSERPRLYSVLSPPFSNRVQLPEHRDGPPTAVRTGRPSVADAATGTTIWADHQLGARANGSPLRRLGDGSDRLPVAEFLSELPDALGAAFGDQDGDFAQPLRS